MRAGRLRHRVTIQQPAETRDADGAVIESWNTYAVRSASVEPKTGRERWVSDQRFAEVDYLVRLRYDSVAVAITPKMRVSYDGRIFNITAVIHVNERRREIHLMCQEEGA